MGNIYKRKVIVMVLSMAFLLVCAVGGTVAYLQQQTVLVTNNFQKNTVSIDFSNDFSGTHKIIPGTSVTKSATVDASATLPSYIFVKVEDNTQGLVSFALDDGWTALNDNSNIYYRDVDGTSSPYAFNLLKDNKIGFPSTITSSDMDKISDSATLVFTSYVIQKTKSGNDANVVEFTKEEAWSTISSSAG